MGLPLHIAHWAYVFAHNVIPAKAGIQYCVEPVPRSGRGQSPRKRGGEPVYCPSRGPPGHTWAWASAGSGVAGVARWLTAQSVFARVWPISANIGLPLVKALRPWKL